MKKSTFWNEASRGGAVIGLVNIAVALLSMYMPKLAVILGLVNLVVTIYLIFVYTRRRAVAAGANGFTYGESLGFIVAMGLFAGIIAGAYQIVAANWLFTEQIEAAYEQSLSMIAQMGGTGLDMDSLMQLYRKMMFSPLPVLFSNVFSSVLRFAFYGLFVSIATKCEPDMFETDVDDDEE